MADNENNTQATPLTAEDIAKIVDGRINNFVHSSKTDIAKLREQVGSISTAIESFKPQPTTEQKTEGTAAPDPRIAVLERQIKELTASNEAATKKAELADRDTALNRALAGYQFANEASRTTAFKVFGDEMQKLEDGKYAIGDQPLEDAVKVRMGDLKGLLAPQPITGSGASKTVSTPSSGIPEIKAGMTREEMQIVANELLKMA